MFFAKVVVDSVVGSRQTGSAGGFDNNHDMFNKNNKNEVCPAQSLDKVVRENQLQYHNGFWRVRGK